MKNYPHLTVATVVYNNGKFLMVHEHAEHGPAYNQPAGHLELGESLTQAAVRETLEETGWEVSLTGFLGISEYYATTNDTTYVRVSFAADPIRQRPNATLDDGIIETKWLTATQINQLPNLRSPLVMTDISRFLKGTILPLDTISTLSVRPINIV